MPKIFISYSRKDRIAADYIATELGKRGADVFIDYQRLTAGKHFVESLALEIENSDYLVFIISPNSVSSRWVDGEVGWAIQHEKTVIPVLLEPASLRKFFVLSHIEQVDFQRWNLDRQVEDAIQKLARAMELPETIKSNTVSQPESPREKSGQLDQSEQGESTDIDESTSKSVLTEEDVAQLFRTAANFEAKDPERAYFLYQRVNELDPDYMGGKARDFITRTTELLKPARIANILKRANRSMQVGDWKQASQLGQDILSLDGKHAEAQQIIEIAQKNLECQPFYQHAIAAAENKQWDATAIFLRNVRASCPDYGHPAGLLIGGHLEAEWADLLSELASLGHRRQIAAMEFSPDGKVLASLQEGGKITLWKVPKGEKITTLTSKASAKRLIGFSPDGSMLAAISQDKTIQVWNTSTGECLATLEGQTRNITGLAFLPDGNSLVSVSNYGSTKLWTIEGIEIPTTLDTSDFPTCALSPDGTLMISADALNTVKLWSVTEGEELVTLQDDTYSYDYFSDDDEDEESDDSNAEDEFESAEDIAAFEFSPSRNGLAAITYGGTVKVWNLPGGEEPIPSLDRASDVGSAVFSPNGDLLALCSTDAKLMVWNLRSGKKLFTQTVVTDPVAFSPNGNILAYTTYSRVQLCSIPDGRQLVSLKGHSDYVSSIAFSPGGNLIATASRDKTIKLWGV